MHWNAEKGNSRKLSARGEVVGGLSRPLLREELNPLLYREQPSLDPSARWGAEYLDLVLLRCGLDLFHVRRFFWWKCSCPCWAVVMMRYRAVSESTLKACITPPGM